MPRYSRTALLLTLALPMLGIFALSVQAQKKPIPSDANLSAIGQRRIDRNPNFYSLDKEQKLGEALSREVQRSSFANSCSSSH